MKKMKRYYMIAVPGFFLVGLLFYHHLVGGIILSAIAFPCRKLYISHLEGKYRADMDVRVKDLLASLSSSFATGRHLTEALAEAKDDLTLIYGEKDPVIDELSKALNRLIVGMEPEKAVMFDLAHALRNEDLENFADVYFTSLATGGNPIKAVQRSSMQLMDKIEIRRAIETVIAQKKYETLILAFLPIVIMGFLQLSSPDYMKPLYSSVSGILIITAALAVMGGAFVWAQRITNVEI